jgi:hypothetical protein
LYENVEKTIILPVVLYGCEIWYLILREEHTIRLEMFENRVLRGIFGPNRERLTDGESYTTGSYTICTPLHI